MRIGIILHPYGEEKPAGLARTIFELTSALIRYDKDNEYVIFLKKKPIIPPQFEGENWHLEILGERYLWLERLARGRPADLYIFNTPVMPLFWKPSRSIVLAPDFAYLHFPPQYWNGVLRNKFTRLYHRYSLKKADRIVTMSEAGKADLLRLFAVSEDKIKAIHWGFKPICEVQPEKIAVPDKFFLFAGVFKIRKNVENIIRAFKELHPRHSLYHLVLAGANSGKYADYLQNLAGENGVKNNIHFLGHLDDAKLSFLYKKASALVFPSLLEGFGFPVLEAMSCGLPVITSNQSSLAELGGEAALLVDPYNPSAIADAMEQVITNQSLRNKLIEQGFRQVKNFNWEKTAAEYKSLFISLGK